MARRSSTLPRLSTATWASDDEKLGVNIVRRALAEPLRWIAENGGEQGYVVTSKVAEPKPGEGYNAVTDTYGDLYADGVIDPVKVTRSALANAASIAALLLTTETLVVEKPEEEDKGAGRPRAFSLRPAKRQLATKGLSS